MTEPAPQVTAEALLNEAQQAIAEYRSTAALAAAQRVMELAGDNPDGHEPLARAHGVCAVAHFDLGNIIESETHLEKAMALYDKLGDERRVAWCDVRTAWCSHERGDLPRAVHLASRVLATARQHGWDDLEAKALLSIGNVAWKRGDRSAALGDLARAAAIFERLGMVSALQRTRGIMGYVKVLNGDLTEGRLLLEEAIEYFKRAGNTLQVVKMISNLAFVHYSGGELPEARELLLQATEICTEECPQPQLIIVFNLGLIELHLGRLKEAKKNLLRASQFAVKLNDPVTEALSLLYLGIIKIRESQPEEGVSLFELSAKVIEGSACEEVGLTAYYLAIGYLVTARVELALKLWEQRVPVSSLMNCLDDFRILVDILDFVCSDAYTPPRKISTDTLQQASSWREQLRREIPPVKLDI